MSKKSELLAQKAILERVASNIERSVEVANRQFSMCLTELGRHYCQGMLIALNSQLELVLHEQKQIDSQLQVPACQAPSIHSLLALEFH